jgi:hypothetical protein
MKDGELLSRLLFVLPVSSLLFSFSTRSYFVVGFWA